MSLAHTHVRLNASQVHNAVRLRLGLDSAPEDRAHRRTVLAAINAALDEVRPPPSISAPCWPSRLRPPAC